MLFIFCYYKDNRQPTRTLINDKYYGTQEEFKGYCRDNNILIEGVDWLTDKELAEMNCVAIHNRILEGVKT
jgi:hypothetical protein